MQQGQATTTPSGYQSPFRNLNQSSQSARAGAMQPPARSGPAQQTGPRMPGQPGSRGGGPAQQTGPRMPGQPGGGQGMQPPSQGGGQTPGGQTTVPYQAGPDEGGPQHPNPPPAQNGVTGYGLFSWGSGGGGGGGGAPPPPPGASPPGLTNPYAPQNGNVPPGQELDALAGSGPQDWGPGMPGWENVLQTSAAMTPGIPGWLRNFLPGGMGAAEDAAGLTSDTRPDGPGAAAPPGSIDNILPNNGAAQEILGNFLSSMITPYIGTMAQLYGDAKDEWNDRQGGLPPGAVERLQELFSQFGYGQTDLMGQLGQNFGSMMNPATWEQMAMNREAALRDTLRGETNDMARRLRSAGAAGGYSADAGIAQLYGDYAGNLAQGQRDIFNDVLGNQMNAAGMASSFGLADQGQRNAWQQGQMGLLGSGAFQDAARAYDEHTTFEDILNNLAGLLGGYYQGAGQMIGGLMGLAGG